MYICFMGIVYMQTNISNPSEDTHLSRLSSQPHLNILNLIKPIPAMNASITYKHPQA